MSSHDAIAATEDLITNLKASEAYVAVASNKEVTTNGYGVHHDDVSNGVHQDDVSNGVHHDDVSNGVNGDVEDATDGTGHSKAQKREEDYEEHSRSPQDEDRLGEVASEVVKEPTPEVEVETTPEVTAETTPTAEEEAVTASVDERIPDLAQLAVCPAKPEDADVEEGGFDESVLDVEVRVPATRLRDEWTTKRQSSLEIKREVEAQSRPVISKAAMSTIIDEKSVRAAYEDVRSDANDAEWAVFKFQAQNIVCSATGTGFDEFRGHFADDERAFGFIRIQMGDEMSKRQKFVFLTWLGPQVSVIRRAKMSIDKAMVKNIVKNFAVELQVESLSEITVEHFREQLARAGGANYGTGFRD